MPWPDDDIPELVKGERPTLLEAEKGNEVINALNALRNLTITAGQVDEVKYADDEVAIVYKGAIGEGFTGTITFDTVDSVSGATIPHFFEFRDGLLIYYTDGS